LWWTLPKSASFLERFLQNDPAVERCGFLGSLPSPETAISGCKPFWFQCRLGLALTSGLRQNAIPDTFRVCPCRPRRTGKAGDLHDSEEYPLADGDRSHSLSESAVLTGDIPRSAVGRGFLFSGAEGSSRTKSREFFLRLPEKIAVNQGEEEEEEEIVADDEGSHDSRDETLGSDSIFSDLVLNSFVNSENLPLFFLQASTVAKVLAPA
jgi:hypothetical protein